MNPSNLAHPRLAFGLEYDGGQFFGYQLQAQTPTVQSVVESALSSVAAAPVRVHAAGRTDTGVHARGQVCHFDPPVARSLRSWLLGANSHLPPGAALVWVQAVSDEFHARFSASSRLYRYRILNRWPRPALDRGSHAWFRQPLNAALMHSAAQALLGEHDFTTFRALGCRAQHAVRRILDIDVTRHDDEIVLRVEGNAFLQHMVRNIVGSLVLVGQGVQPPSWLADILGARDRSQAGPTAPAEGLCLEAVRYPRVLGIPERPCRKLEDTLS